MSIESEKKLVSGMRSDEGLTLQQIANRLGKSIYWVNSRLNRDYEPQRERLTAADEATTNAEEGIVDDEPSMTEEVERIHKFRQDGLTYEQIATRLDRSVYWVHSRLRAKYRPSKMRTERLFQEQRVVPFLISLGHELVGQCLRVGNAPHEQEADVVTMLGQIMCVTEVKLAITHHQLQTAIGQLSIHRYALRNYTSPILQLALPVEAVNSRLSEEFARYLAESLKIDLLLIPLLGEMPLEGGEGNANI